MNLDLFSNEQSQARKELGSGAFLLRGFALRFETELLRDITNVITDAPLRKMFTPSGLPMSVMTTSCGTAGWLSDAHGYRYSKRDLHSQQSWPAMP
ncbi:MAG: alpha-ketoglutarate-dependent dioxygenase AlkB, partial [Moraxellaceae bacterium]